VFIYTYIEDRRLVRERKRGGREGKYDKERKKELGEHRPQRER
jgi:hypothetical protein